MKIGEEVDVSVSEAEELPNIMVIDDMYNWKITTRLLREIWFDN